MVTKKRNEPKFHTMETKRIKLSDKSPEAERYRKIIRDRKKAPAKDYTPGSKETTSYDAGGYPVSQAPSTVPDYSSFGRKPQPQSFLPERPEPQRVGPIREAVPPVEKKISYISQTGKYQYPFSSKEGQRERLDNTFDVLKLAVNPFSRGYIEAQINNPLLRKGTEYMANNPHQVALLGASISNGYGLVTKLTTSGESLTAAAATGTLGAASAGALAKGGVKAAGAVTSNPATTAAAVRGVSSVLSGLKYPAIIFGIVSTYLFGLQYQANPTGDAIQQLGIAKGASIKAGNTAAAREFSEMIEEIGNPDLARRIKKYIPVWNVLIGEQEKIDSGLLVNKLQNEQMDKDIIASNAALEMEDKIKNNDATPEERAQYAKDYPYSPEANAWLAGQKNLDVNGDSVYGSVDEDDNYIPSATEIAKDKWEAENKNKDALGNDLFGYVNENGVYVPSYTELQKRIESQQYYKSISGGGSGERAEFEPPSSLNFGLLKTAGGYQPASKDDPNVEGEWVTDPEEIAGYYFNIPYGQLTAEQKELIDMMVG